MSIGHYMNRREGISINDCRYDYLLSFDHLALFISSECDPFEGGPPKIEVSPGPVSDNLENQNANLKIMK